MKRRELLLGLATAAFGSVSECAIRAQPAANVLHIAAILPTPPTASYWVIFIRRLRELGYREGENLFVTTFDVREDTDHLLEKLKDKIKKGINVVYAGGPE